MSKKSAFYVKKNKNIVFLKFKKGMIINDSKLY